MKLAADPAAKGEVHADARVRSRDGPALAGHATTAGSALPVNREAWLRRNRAAAVLITTAAMLAPGARPAPAQLSEVPEPAIEWQPRSYTCRRAPGPLTIDGSLEEAAWKAADWTDEFVDIEGTAGPAPSLRTRVKMLWDDRYFYVAAEMEEPHLWATLTDHDAVIYHDNDFELFIDPDGDSHEYYELEVNALGTEWDLLLVRPYRDGGPAVDAWDIQGLMTGVSMSGTLNDPSDTDQGWSVEIAVPWSVLDDCAGRPCPPGDGDRWRVNFSRVEWQLDVSAGKYVKRTHTSTGKPLPECNWVWSPQGIIAMHYPEMWGFVQFDAGASGSMGRDGEPTRPLPTSDVERAAWALRRIYYRERNLYAAEGRFSGDVGELGLEAEEPGGHSWPPSIFVTPRGFEASVTATDGTLVRIDELGRLTTEPAH